MEASQASLKEGERLDEIGFGDLRLIQKPKEFCYGIDSVLLAAFAEIKKGERVIDLGTGSGVILLILSWRTEAAGLVGIELQEGSYDRACRTAALNHLSERIHMIRCDVKDAALRLGTECFDAAVSNPPYNRSGNALINENHAKTIARHETTAGLEDFIRGASELLKSRGSFYLVHRPSRLVDIFALSRKYGLEPKRLCLVSPKQGVSPNILLVHCVKGGNPELTVLPPLYVYSDEGGYTKEILEFMGK